MDTKEKNILDNNTIKTTWTIGSKLFIIGFLLIVMTMALAMIGGLIEDRGDTKTKAIDEIHNTWGKSQVLQGPILTVPYIEYSWVYKDIKINNSNKTKTIKEQKRTLEYIHFLPETLDIKGDITPSIRYRGIYEAVVYNSSLNISGTFAKIDMKEWQIPDKDIRYDLATVSFGISDLRGVEDRIKVVIDGTDNYFEPGIKLSQISTAIPSGVSTLVGINKNKHGFEFDFDIKLRGSGAIRFLPYGKSTVVHLNSNWDNPSFIGDFLPITRQIDKDGFKATWKVIDINRPYPQKFVGEDIQRLYDADMSDQKDNNYGFVSAFGVDLQIPVDIYQKNYRAVEYGLLIIILTFITFFFVEVFRKRPIHPLQYILVGSSLVLFFGLLISLSEHIGFDMAYLVASVATILSVVLYSISVFRQRKAILSLFGILSLFYIFIYQLLQMQDYALILGMIMLFVVLAVVMYISRNIDWYNITNTTKK